MDDAQHGQLMNAVYRNQRYIYDITRKYYLLGRDRLIETLAPPQGGRVLEVACGTGRNLVAIGRHYPEARLFGFDISTEMLTTARGSIEKAGMGRRARLAEGDACDFDPEALFGEEAFDRIVLSYSLSMIPDWKGAVAEALAHLAPGGELHIVDFGDQARLPAWFRRMLVAWLEKFHVAPRLEMETMLTEAAAARDAQLTFRPLYRGYAWSAVIKLP